MELINKSSLVQESATKKKQFWEGHKKQQKESGLSSLEYCKKHQLNYRQFHYWSAKKTQEEQVEVSKLIPIHIETLQSSAKKQADTLCTLVFKKGYELKIHDQTLLPSLLSLLS